MQKHSFRLSASVLVALFLVGMYAPAHAETLDDATIRQIYTEIKGAIHNPTLLTQLMNQRLDDNYVLKSNVTRIVGNGAPQQVSGTMMKQQVVTDTVKNMSAAKMQNYDSKVTSIQFSDDGKYATVYDSTITSGSVDIPAGQQGGVRDVQYVDKETCSHIVTLINETVKIMQSQCDDQITLNK